MRLHDPWALLLLFLVPLLLWWRRRTHRSGSVRYPTLDAFESIPNRGRVRWRILLSVLRAGVLTLLLLGMTRPQFGRLDTSFSGLGIDIMLAVDISSSMLAEDFSLDGRRANRLEVVKSVVKDFANRRTEDRLGLLLFGARPYTQCPLTLDHGWLLQNLARAEVGMIEDGTAIGSALAVAAARLQRSDAKSKILILLTDGQNNAGKISPLTAAEALRALGIKAYTIGAGTRGLAPYPALGPFGNKIYQPVSVDIDEETLQKIADTTGGAYFRATDTESLQKIYTEIDRLERTEFSAPRSVDYRELYPWLVVPALLLLFAEVGLRETLLRKLP